MNTARNLRARLQSAQPPEWQSCKKIRQMPFIYTQQKIAVDERVLDILAVLSSYDCNDNFIHYERPVEKIKVVADSSYS